MTLIVAQIQFRDLCRIVYNAFVSEDRQRMRNALKFWCKRHHGCIMPYPQAPKFPWSDSTSPIKQAAILRDGVLWTLPRPARHHNILWAMHDIDNNTNPHERPKIIHARGIQGFIDEDGNFLERKEAALRATRCGQLKKPLDAPPNLFSEDLW